MGTKRIDTLTKLGFGIPLYGQCRRCLHVGEVNIISLMFHRRKNEYWQGSTQPIVCSVCGSRDARTFVKGFRGER